MQVYDPNDVKIYNLTCGKSLPEWLSDKKRRKLSRKDFDFRRRIELLQDFDMPDISNNVKISKDGQYVMATGIYKPRVRCYEVYNLAMKFERGLDAEVVTFEILSDDYSKIAFLQNDRYVDFHASGGIYHRMRIPKYGYDLKYHQTTGDLLLCGASDEIYRFNLERGQFLKGWQTETVDQNRLAINSVHRLVVVGGAAGKVEAWDPRSRNRVATLDVALNVMQHSPGNEGFPSVTSLEFDGSLEMGVGVATGQVLLYDIRSNRPLLTKDHLYNLPIRDLAFQEKHVLSMDQACVKIWHRQTGKMLTFIESGSETLFNNLCHVPNSGLMFIANESRKILAYYIPNLAPAPRWCSFLDNLTEELEESKAETVYDDYKFVTKSELHDLGLSHLLGTSMLRAYMHGYFVNVRLWRKAKEASEPFKFEEYKKKRIRENLEAARPNRVRVENLPKVNKDLALRIMDQANLPKKKLTGTNLMQDERFKDLFKNPDYQIDPNSEEFRLMNPVLSRMQSARRKQLETQKLQEKFELIQDEQKGDSDKDILGTSEEESSEDETEMREEMRQVRREVRQEKRVAERQQERQETASQTASRTAAMYRLKPGETFTTLRSFSTSSNNNQMSLEERLSAEQTSSNVKSLQSGNREMTFTPFKTKLQVNAKESRLRHKIERKKLVRKAPQSFAGKKQRWNKHR